jgi:hypothetical protein
MAKEFREHLNEAHREVSRWPKWKQAEISGYLGLNMQPSDPVPYNMEEAKAAVREFLRISDYKLLIEALANVLQDEIEARQTEDSPILTDVVRAKNVLFMLLAELSEESRGDTDSDL